MSFTIKALLGGFAAVVAGILATAMGFMKEGNDRLFPAGMWAGPLITVLGIILIVLSVKSLTTKP